ncbi:hypothetical protein [Prochlorothrix hollandica]|nr:hypothetical protein [Prochlorothrix hollandica]
MSPGLDSGASRDYSHDGSWPGTLARGEPESLQALNQPEQD